MSIVNYSIAFKALDYHIKEHNQNTDQLSNRIRQAIASTAKDIIKIYGLSLLKASNVTTLDLKNLPPLKTNNLQLAKMGNASPRTIQRHLKRLIDAGIIINKKWHGTNSGYDLWVEPKILLATGLKPVDKPKIQQDSQKLQSTHNQSVKNIPTTTCRHTDSSNNGYINNLIIGVDNSSRAKLFGNKRNSLPLTKETTSRNASSNTFTGYTGKKCPKNSNDAGENARMRATNQTGAENLPRDSARSASLSVYVNALWTLSRNVLYQDTYLTESQVKIGKELLWKWYDPVPDKHLANVHQCYVDRIELVRKYLAKDPQNRFVQLPHQYFDSKNKTGFAGTKKWWQDHKKRQLEVQLKLIVASQIRRFLNNEKKDTAKQKPRLALFKQCETRIGKLGQPELLQHFHASVFNPSTQRFLYTNN